MPDESFAAEQPRMKGNAARSRTTLRVCAYCGQPIEREDVSVVGVQGRRVTHLLCWTPSSKRRVVT